MWPPHLKTFIISINKNKHVQNAYYAMHYSITHLILKTILWKVRAEIWGTASK